MAAAFQPALSSVRQDWQAGGSLLAQKMLALIRGEEVASQVLPVSLMVRAT
jgi:DNA-binding LacI/PurR family transcriptional regulator